ncbi:hypothetical protein N9L19_01005, partial [bacterium]|nr:hypothetical protein [bacterium]
PIADLHMNLALENRSEKLHEITYDAITAPTSKSSQYTVAGHPRGDVPVGGGAAALVLGLHDPLEYNKEFVPVASDEK